MAATGSNETELTDRKDTKELKGKIWVKSNLGAMKGQRVLKKGALTKALCHNVTNCETQRAQQIEKGKVLNCRKF